MSICCAACEILYSQKFLVLYETVYITALTNLQLGIEPWYRSFVNPVNPPPTGNVNRLHQPADGYSLAHIHNRLPVRDIDRLDILTSGYHAIDSCYSQSLAVPHVRHSTVSEIDSSDSRTLS